MDAAAGADLLISIHGNSFPQQKSSSGAQVFYANDPTSNSVAKDMQSALISALNPDSHRQAKPANGVYLMEHIEKPGILIECGFISNPEEATKLNDFQYQNKLCSVIAATLCRVIANT